MTDLKYPPWPNYGSLDPARAVARRNDVVVGSVVFEHDVNARVYPMGGNGRMSERHTFRAAEVVGETARSWVVGPWKTKHPKKDAAGIYGLEDVEDWLWVNSHAHRIADEVRRTRDADVLRSVAKLIGFAP